MTLWTKCSLLRSTGRSWRTRTCAWTHLRCILQSIPARKGRTTCTTARWWHARQKPLSISCTRQIPCNSFKPTQECACKAPPTFPPKTKVSKCRWWIAVKTTNTRSGFCFQSNGIDRIPYRFLRLLPPLFWVFFINLFFFCGEVEKATKTVIKTT